MYPCPSLWLCIYNVHIYPCPSVYKSLTLYDTMCPCPGLSKSLTLYITVCPCPGLSKSLTLYIYFFYKDLQPTRAFIFLLVTDTDIYTDRGDACRLGTGRDLNLVLWWMWGFLPHFAGLPSFRRFFLATIVSDLWHLSPCCKFSSTDWHAW